MDRAPVAISVLLAAAASLAAEPPAHAPAAADTADAPTFAEAAESFFAAEPFVPVAPTPAAAAPAETVALPTSAEIATADVAPPAADAPPAAVPAVDMKTVTDDTVCRKERPTGSQIGVKRCYSRSASTLKDDEQMRRDIDEMRMRQNDQQAREAAAAMTRRRGLVQ
jgi:hypothetical protein